MDIRLTAIPMAILSSMINTLSCYNTDVMEMEEECEF